MEDKNNQDIDEEDLIDEEKIDESEEETDSYDGFEEHQDDEENKM